MSGRLDNQALECSFRAARTRNGWAEQPVTDQQLRELYDLMKFGPTSGNRCPARYVWVRTESAGFQPLPRPPTRQRFWRCRSQSSSAMIATSPRNCRSFPARGKDMQAYYSDPQVARTTAFRNGSLQGAYLIIAARAWGLDCGPMSGFNNEAVDSEFFADTRIKSNFICSIGYGSNEALFPRNPRLTFEEAGRFA